MATALLLCASPLLAVAGSQSSPRAVAYIFTTTDCPIANRYAPEIERLHKTFASRAVEFRLVYVNPREDTGALAAHADKYGYSMATQRDFDHALVRRFGITVTPEVAVVDNSGETLYRGRIDDRYTAIGVDRQRATQHDLADALAAIVAGRPVATPTTRAVGCFVADFQPPTFARDIAPLVDDKCASCHRPGGAAPFSLLSYRDVRQRASLIAEVTERRYMPPYRGDSAAGDFIGHKRLAVGEIATIRRWVDAGSPEGEPNAGATAPTFAAGWHLGRPDLIVSPLQPYTLGPEASDVFRIFVIRLPVDGTRFVTGLEFHPGNARVVHHANIRLDRTAKSRELDAADPAPGYDGLLARSAMYPDGHFLGWTPGQIAPLVPDDMAWRLEPGTDLVVQLHMQPSGAVEQVQPTIGLYFGKKPPTRTPTILRLGSQGIDISPFDGSYRISDTYTLPVDVELHALQPHAHYRLREVEGTATLPDGQTTSLLQIADWDFRWQHVYRFSSPVALPKGTRVSMRYRYDNSADNPRNPQQPPQRVLWGQRSVDEMGDLWFQFVTSSDADRALLNSEILRKMTAEDVVGYETMLRVNPRDAELHDDVALLYLSLDRAADAVAHFEASVGINPESPAARFNLGTALSLAGRLDEAVGAYRAALARRPNYPAAHNNLGTVLAARGDLAQAIPHFREAVRGDRNNVQAQRNLAHYLTATPSPDASAAREAVAAAEAAVQLTASRDPAVLDVLAAAYRAAGLNDKAAAAETTAKRLQKRP